jgi:hypothetical protein
MKKIALLLAFSLFFTLFSYSSFFSGNTINSKTKKPVEYVNIGIVGKNIGTVADENGKYKIDLDSKYDNDTLRFSCIGYSSFSIKVADFKKLKSDILLEEKITEMKEVVIFPKVFKQKTLGWREIICPWIESLPLAKELIMINPWWQDRINELEEENKKLKESIDTTPIINLTQIKERK